MAKIEVTVALGGNVNVEGKDFVGGACREAIDALTQGMSILSDESKEEEVRQIVTV